MIYHKTTPYPWQGADDLYKKARQFAREVEDFEAAGWVRDIAGLCVWEHDSDTPEGCFRITCTILSPDEPETAALRAVRLDLKERT